MYKKYLSFKKINNIILVLCSRAISLSSFVVCFVHIIYEDLLYNNYTLLFTGDHKKEDYIRKVPSHTVPAIEDDGFILSEW